MGPEEEILAAKQTNAQARMTDLFNLCDSLGIVNTRARLEIIKSCLDELDPDLHGLLLKHLPVTEAVESDEEEDVVL